MPRPPFSMRKDLYAQLPPSADARYALFLISPSRHHDFIFLLTGSFIFVYADDYFFFFFAALLFYLFDTLSRGFSCASRFTFTAWNFLFLQLYRCFISISLYIIISFSLMLKICTWGYFPSYFFFFFLMRQESSDFSYFLPLDSYNEWFLRRRKYFFFARIWDAFQMRVISFFRYDILFSYAQIESAFSENRYHLPEMPLATFFHCSRSIFFFAAMARSGFRHASAYFITPHALFFFFFLCISKHFDALSLYRCAAHATPSFFHVIFQHYWAKHFTRSWAFNTPDLYAIICRDAVRCIAVRAQRIFFMHNTDHAAEIAPCRRARVWYLFDGWLIDIFARARCFFTIERWIEMQSKQMLRKMPMHASIAFMRDARMPPTCLWAMAWRAQRKRG